MVIQQKDVMISHGNKTFKDGLYLGFTLTNDQIDQLIKESKTRSTGLWKDPENRDEKYSPQERYSYKNFSLKQVFETLDSSTYKVKK